MIEEPVIVTEKYEKSRSKLNGTLKELYELIEIVDGLKRISCDTNL